jgi:hypothetical protein
VLAEKVSAAKVSAEKVSAAKVSAEIGTHLEVPISTITVRRELQKSNIHSRAAIAKLLNTGNNTKRKKRWCVDHKPGRLIIGNVGRVAQSV